MARTTTYEFWGGHNSGLIFLVLSPRVGVPNMWLKPLAPQGGSPSLRYPPFLLCPLLGAWVLSWLLLLPSHPTLWGFSYSLGCRRTFLPASRLFAVRVAPHVDVFWCVCWGRWALHHPTPPPDLPNYSCFIRYFNVFQKTPSLLFLKFCFLAIVYFSLNFKIRLSNIN